MSEKTAIGYMCKTAFDYDLYDGFRDIKIYPSIKALINSRSCVQECGIVEVEVKLNRVIIDGEPAPRRKK